MASIVDISIKRPLVALVVFTALTLGGLVCYNMLNLNILPRIEAPVMTVATTYPGAGASEVETGVTKKIEDALSSLENVNKITSSSLENMSVITVHFNEGVDINQLAHDAQRKISAIKSTLPKEILDPSISKMSVDDKPIMKIAASSSLPPTQFFKLMEDRVQPRLAKLPGVGSVNMAGGNEREIRVNIDAERLRAYNLSVVQVLQAVQSANIEIPAGSVENDKATYSVRLAAKYGSLDDMGNTVLAVSANGGETRLRDVAEIHDGVAEQKIVNRIDGREAIGLSVVKQGDANTVNVADLIKAELRQIENEYAADHVKFEIPFDDSIFTKASADAVVVDLFLAILIVSIVCFLFLHNIRSALIVMIAVPLSIVPAFIVLYLLGYSLNMMSLMALSLAVGILVDDSIVVIENMVTHIERGKSRLQATLDGCRQIMFTVMTITCVITVVFLPMVFSGGRIGNLLKEFALPIVVATLSSLLVSFTVTPLLFSKFGKVPVNTRLTLSGRFSIFVENLFSGLKNMYARILSVSLKHKITVIISATVLFISSFILIGKGFIGFAFIPETDQGEFTLNIDMNPSVTMYQNNLITMDIERILREKPEIVQVYANAGSTGAMFGNSSKNNAASIDVKMVDRKERNIDVYAYSQKIKDEIMQLVPGVRVRVSVAAIGGFGGDSPVQLIVQGADYGQVQSAANTVLEIVRQTPGTTDVKMSVDAPRQEVQVKLDRDKISQMGLTAADVGVAMRTALAGNDDCKFTEGNYEYDIRVRIDDFDRTQAGDVSRLTVLNRRGELIELQDIADISYTLGASTLERNNRIASITILSNVVGRPSGTVGNEILASLEGQMPQGVTVKPSGALEQQSSAFGSLLYAFLAAIVIIYLIMVVMYNSLLDPLIVLMSIPLALIGAFLALALTLNNLTNFSIIGLIVLIGLVAKNAILLVDFANSIRREQNMDAFHALIEAGKERLRPILMTTFAMIFGMLPIALAAGNGAEIKSGMAWVIIGGLASSMLLTLVVVPVVYLTFDGMKRRIERVRQKRVAKKLHNNLVINSHVEG
jgi:HAE1 family hydrophobic/amphiphilic exporter-1